MAGFLSGAARILYFHGDRACSTFSPGCKVLLKFDFFIFYVLACYRIEFKHFQFLRSNALILGRGIEMTGSGRRFELYFFSHDDVLRFRNPNVVL